MESIETCFLTSDVVWYITDVVWYITCFLTSDVVWYITGIYITEL